jgi:hypothetical protein
MEVTAEAVNNNKISSSTRSPKTTVYCASGAAESSTRMPATGISLFVNRNLKPSK